MLPRFLKIIAYTALTLLVPLLITAGITQTQLFKDQLRSYLLNTVSEKLNGTLALGTIRGNFLTGFTIDSVAISRNERPLFTTGKISFRHDPFTLVNKTLTITHLVIQHPHVYFERSAGGVWNLSGLFKTSDDTAKGSFDWTIILHALDVHNGGVTFVDSLSLLSPNHVVHPVEYFEYHDFEAEDIDIRLSATVKENDVTARISSLSGYTPGLDFLVKNFNGTFHMDNKQMKAERVTLQTRKSLIQFSASLKGASLFTGIHLAALQHDSTQLEFTARNVDIGELKSFLPPVDFLDGTALLDLKAEGIFGNLAIKRLILQTERSSFNLIGYLRNLHQPKDLFIDVFAGDSHFDPAELPNVFPGAGFPSFNKLGMTSFYAQFTGTPKEFKATSTIKGSYGEFTTTGDFNFHQPLPQYDLSFTTKELAVDRFFDDTPFTAELSAHGDLAGKGTSLATVTSELTIAIDSARYRHFPFSASNLFITTTPYTFKGNGTLTSQGMSLQLASTLDLHKSAVPVFTGEFTASAIDVSKILGDGKYSTNLSLTGSVEGSGSTIDNLSTTGSISLSPSRVNTLELGEEQIDFALDQHDFARKRLMLRSSVADLDLDGAFDLDVVATAVPAQITNLIERIAEKVRSKDSLAAKVPRRAATPERHSPEERSMDFRYSLTIKNLEPVAGVLDGRPFNAYAEIDGTIKGSDEQLYLTANGAIDEFFIGSLEGGVLVHNGTFNVALDNLTTERTLSRLAGTVAIDVETGIVNSHHVDSLRASIDYADTTGTFAVHGMYDSLVTIHTHGELRAAPNAYGFVADTFALGIGHVTWMNEGTVHATLDDSVLRVTQAHFIRPGRTLDIDGTLSHKGVFDATLDARNLDLSKLGRYRRLRPADSPNPHGGLSGNADMTVHLRGTGAAPIFTAVVHAESLYYRSTPLGTVHAGITYADRAAELDIRESISPNDSLPNLVLKGTLPIDLAFSGVTDRFPDRQQNLRVFSDGFPITFFELLFPELEEMSGKIVCDLTITGTPRLPDYVGTLSIRDARFTFVPNNVAYLVSGDLVPSRNILTLKNFLLRNVPEDRTDGEAQVNGTLTFRDFQLSSFEVNAKGKLLVMTDASRRNLPTLYGRLFAEMDAGGLTLSGTPNEPFLSGKFYILDADLVFPPTRAEVLSGSALTLRYVHIDDTVKPKQAPPVFARRFFSGEVDTAVADTTAAPLGAGLSFVDKLRYDLEIETLGPTRIRMIFTPSTNEELYAELEGKVTAINMLGTPNIYGEIDIGTRSYYNFLKKFDASGTMKYVGPWDNPEMDVEATYEGYRLVNEGGLDTTGRSTVERRVVVLLTITGTRYEPKLAMTVQEEEEEGGKLIDRSTETTGGDVQSDAISFILTGKFRDQLTSKDNQNLITGVGSSAGSSVFSGLTTNFLSGVLTDFLRQEFPFIRSVDVSYQGTGTLQESADLRISGEAFEGYWRFGGKIVNDIGNANLSYQLSLGKVFDKPSIRNLFIELERRVDAATINDPEKKLTNAARVYYRISF